MKASTTLGMFGSIAMWTLVASACASGVVSVGDPDGVGGAGGRTAPLPASGAGGSTTSVVIELPDASIGSGGVRGASTSDVVVACIDGSGCICPTLDVAVVGTPGVWGDGSDTAFQDWLNSNSAGTAKVDNYPHKPTFTADFLAGYSLIILAGLGDNSNTGPWWTFSTSEVAAFQDWIVTKGGGVISLSGYSNDNNDITAKNALLAFSGISYKQECNSPPCTIVDASNNKMCYRCGNPYQLTEWNRSDPVIANLSFGITMVGVDGGRPISASADAHVAATVARATSVDNWLVGKITGKGRVLVYADEWITYTDQWSGHNGSNDPSCNGFLPKTLYQTAQFWYNMIRWAQPNDNCFKIVDGQQPITVW
ncbi:MAG TPA: hypothetical protein VF550_22680 [Polyangia bacterium]